MNIKQLFLAVVAVGLFAMLALYLMEINKIAEQNPGDPIPVSPSANTDTETDDDAEEAEEPSSPSTQVPTGNAGNLTAPAPTPDPDPPVSNPPAITSPSDDDGGGIDETLSELDSLFEEDYDDSGVDASFSGNLDEDL